MSTPMASIDPAVAAVLDRASKVDDSDDEDALIAALEDDDDHTLTVLREQRLQQLHSEISRAKQMKDAGTGAYTEIKDEKQVMDIITGTKLVVVHFFKSDFGRCGVIDKHLEVRGQRISRCDTKLTKSLLRSWPRNISILALSRSTLRMLRSWLPNSRCKFYHVSLLSSMELVLIE